MTKETSITSVRDQIDQIDSDLLKMVNARIELARTIGKLKEQGSKSSKQDEESAPQYYRPEREAQVLRRLKQENQGRLQSDQIETLFREVMSICRGAEGKLIVATLGPEGTFSEQAAIQQFGSAVAVELFSTIDGVFAAVESGSANFGVVPIENSTGGGVTLTTDRLVSTTARVSGEIYLPIHQMLLAASSDIAYRDVRKVFSHAQSINQCQGWITRNIPQAEIVRVASNAEAARLVSEEADVVAIAGEIAAMRYGLQLVEKNIEDIPNNTTRFLVLSNQDVAPSGDDKTSLLFSTKNRPGALYDLLEPLRKNKISMSRIESRPSRLRRWEYVFFVDIEGHQQEKNIAQALSELEKEAGFFTNLGSYPRAD